MSTQSSEPAQDDIDWPTDLDSSDGIHLRVMGLLYLFPTKWIHRRVESIKFDNHETCRYESVDFELPKQVVDTLSAHGIQTIFVPVAYLDKMPLADLNVWDSQGHRLCTSTRSENERFSHMLLKRMAMMIIGKKLDGEVDQGLKAIINAEPPEAFRAIADLWNIKGQAQVLLSHPLMRGLTEDAAVGHPMFVPARVTTSRQLIKFSFSSETGLSFGPDWREGIDTFALLKNRLWNRVRRFFYTLRWWKQTQLFDISHAVICRSYHFDIVAPEGFEFRDVRAIDRLSSKPVPALCTVFPKRASIYLSQDRGLTPTSTLVAECVLRLPRRGLLSSAWLSTFLTMAALIGVGLTSKHLTGIHGQTGAGVAILLALAQFANLWLSRPNEEHESYGNMLLGLRCVLIVSALAGLAGIILLLAWVHRFWPGWFIVSAIAGLAFFFVDMGRTLTGPDAGEGPPIVSSDIKYATLAIVGAWAYAFVLDTRLWWAVATAFIVTVIFGVVTWRWRRPKIWPVYVRR